MHSALEKHFLTIEEQSDFQNFRPLAKLHNMDSFILKTTKTTAIDKAVLLPKYFVSLLAQGKSVHLTKAQYVYGFVYPLFCCRSISSPTHWQSNRCVHAHIRTCMYTHTCTHTHSLSLSLLPA